ncbi:MAG: copper chaperone PCu(A)C [Burkholderiaceae bacterium]
MKQLFAAALLSCAAFASIAQAPAIAVDGAWARASVQGQRGTGAFMKLTAREELTLVGVASPVAGVAEIHEMKMENDVMRMRAIDKLALPAGKPVELSPGGFHIMLMDLKAPLAKDTTIPVTLLVRNAKGAQSRIELKVPVSARAPQGQAGHKH